MEEIDFSRKKSGNHEKFGKMKLNFRAKNWIKLRLFWCKIFNLNLYAKIRFFHWYLNFSVKNNFFFRSEIFLAHFETQCSISHACDIFTPLRKTAWHAYPVFASRRRLSFLTIFFLLLLQTTTCLRLIVESPVLPTNSSSPQCQMEP